MTRRAVVLLSGGLDSATCAFEARAAGYEIYALTIAYGQRHSREIEAAGHIAELVGAAEHKVAQLDLTLWGGSALTDPSIDVPVDGVPAGIPSTYVPARNTIFLSFALAWAEVLEAGDIFIGVNALDYSGYPDCRPEYVEAFERLANLATKAAVEGQRPVRVRAPLISLTKRQIVELGTRLGVDYALTLSCYDPSPDGAACGRCDACQLRRKGFDEAGLRDPTRYWQAAGAAP